MPDKRFLLEETLRRHPSQIKGLHLERRKTAGPKLLIYVRKRREKE